MHFAAHSKNRVLAFAVILILLTLLPVQGYLPKSSASQTVSGARSRIRETSRHPPRAPNKENRSSAYNRKNRHITLPPGGREKNGYRDLPRYRTIRTQSVDGEPGGYRRGQ